MVEKGFLLEVIDRPLNHRVGA